MAPRSFKTMFTSFEKSVKPSLVRLHCLFHDMSFLISLHDSKKQDNNHHHRAFDLHPSKLRIVEIIVAILPISSSEMPEIHNLI